MSLCLRMSAALVEHISAGGVEDGHEMVVCACDLAEYKLIIIDRMGGAAEARRFRKKMRRTDPTYGKHPRYHGRPVVTDRAQRHESITMRRIQGPTHV